jgi:hypothetical protein
MAALVILGTLVNDLIIIILGKSFLFISRWPVQQAMPKLSQGVVIGSVYNVIVFMLLYWPLVKIESYLEFYARRSAGEKSFQKR